MLNKDINLLPNEIIKIRENKKKFRNILTKSVLSILIISIIISALYFNIQRLNLKKEELQKAIAQYTGIFENENSPVEGQNKALQLQNVLSKIQEQEKDNLSFFSLLEKAIPKNIIINSITMLEGEITINGIGPDEEAIANFIYNINKSDIIKLVHLTSILDNGTSKTFTLRCNINKRSEY